MNKRGTKILIGCILCTMIVLLLFLVVFRFTQLSCELVSLDPVQLAGAQLASFSRERTKPIRSHDETILMKISAYLEYNIQPDVSETPPPIQPLGGNGSRPMATGNTGGPFMRAQSDLDSSIALVRNNLTASGTNNPLATPPAANNINNKNSPLGRSQPQGPQPSAPQLGLTNQQHNGSAEVSPLNQNIRLDAIGQFSPSNQQQQTKFEKRFLPLELKSIETRNLPEGRHKYILNFNCTKINMFLVHQDNRVYVDKMVLELRPSSRQETTCEVQLPPSGEFTVADSSQSLRNQPQPPVLSGPLIQSGAVGTANGQVHHGPTGQLVSGGVGSSFATNVTANNLGAGKHSNGGSPTKDYPHFAHYYCNKPLRYSCYHYNSKSGPSHSNGILLAELHINGIEFETSTNWQGKHKKVKSEFKSARSECNI